MATASLDRGTICFVFIFMRAALPALWIYTAGSRPTACDVRG
jgi:hypothetical protein